MTGAPMFKWYDLASTTMSTSNVDVAGHGAGFYFLFVIVKIAIYLTSSWVLFKMGVNCLQIIACHCPERFA